MLFGDYAPHVGIGLIVLVLVLWWVNGTLDPFTEREQPKTPARVYPTIAPELQRELMAAVCPEIRRVLEDELRAGNRIIGGGTDCDWPWPDSTIITLDLIFQGEPKPLPAPLSFCQFDHKKGEGDSVYCLQHRIVVFASMPTLEEHQSKSVIVGGRRKKLLQPQD